MLISSANGWGVCLQVRGNVQSSDGHQGGPPGYYHLGHSDRPEEEGLPL